LRIKKSNPGLDCPYTFGDPRGIQTGIIALAKRDVQNIIKKSLLCETLFFFNGSPSGVRTRVTGVRGRINQIEQEQEIIINICYDNKLVDLYKKPNRTSKYLKIPI